MKKFNLQSRFAKRKRRYYLKTITYLLLGFTVFSLIWNSTVKLYFNSLKPVDAYLVLGGSIIREVYVSKIAQPDIPIIISKGSDDPCIFYIFEREKAPMNNVWLEKCADSTFGNFFFSIPILKKWGVHKVKVFTSKKHFPRAKIMAKILFYTQGLALELETVKEKKGIPGNHENKLKTFLDVTRSLMWAVGAQVINPHCDNVIKLSEVDLNWWQKQGFECESRGKVKIPVP